MKPEQIAEHNHTFEQATRLVKPELIVHGSPYPSGLEEAIRLKLEKSLQLFEHVLELNPQNWSAMWYVGKVHQRFADWSTALSWFARAHAINPSQSDVAREASISAMYLGRSEDAISYARKALHSLPSDGGLQANLALALMLSGKLEEAKAIIGKAMTLDSTDRLSQTIRDMIVHFIAVGERPPTTTGALEDYWKARRTNVA